MADELNSMRASLAGLLLPLALAGCQEPEGCFLTLNHGIEVQVRDAATGAPLTVTPRGLAKDGAFEDSLRVRIPGLDETLVGADERQGTYVVQIEAEGYQPWDTSGVRVLGDRCHVRTEGFTANLERDQ